MLPQMELGDDLKFAVLVSANAEWAAVKSAFPAPSVERDLTPATLRDIEDRYHPTAVDWESGAIAWVAKRNRTPLLIMRGVSDLVSLERGEAEGNGALWVENTRRIMSTLIANLPKWM